MFPFHCGFEYSLLNFKKHPSDGIDDEGPMDADQTRRTRPAKERDTMESKKSSKRPSDKRISLVLQGGGALGAYQAGVYQALEEYGYTPDWVAGTSIGAINGGIIAGNTAQNRRTRLEEFWRTISERDFWNAALLPDDVQSVYSFWSAAVVMLAGRPGFFTPRPFNPLAAFPLGSAETASYYDTTPLRDMLEHLIDFDRINDQTIRLSLGAVNVTTGTLRYFDSKKELIRPEHIMASGALPPGFPAVRVEGELYWDGGIYSNTPLDAILDDMPRVDNLCFMVALFNPAGPEPRSIPQVETRHKDIAYGTRAKEHIQAYSRTHNLRRALHALYDRLPDDLRKDQELRALVEQACHTTMHIVQLIYPARDWELALKDIDFSRSAIEDRWARGYRDVARMIEWCPWEKAVPPHTGVVVHNLPIEPE